MTDNKIKGIVKTVSEKNKGIFLLVEGNNNGQWYNGINVNVPGNLKEKK